jgi:hypothetical protein
LEKEPCPDHRPTPDASELELENTNAHDRFNDFSVVLCPFFKLVGGMIATTPPLSVSTRNIGILPQRQAEACPQRVAWQRRRGFPRLRVGLAWDATG